MRRLQVRLEEQEERNKTLREVNAELRRQLQRRDESGTAVNKPIPASAGKKVSARLIVFIHVIVGAIIEAGQPPSNFLSKPFCHIVT